MNWHIITASKGGSGKTLLSLMLTNYSRTQGEVLVVDLNGMNADISRLIADHETSVHIEVKLDVGKFHVEKPMGQSYMIGWLEDAFNLMSIQDFQQFFLQIRERVLKRIHDEISFGVSTVIIDTNYHFCNIFPNRLSAYREEPFSAFGKNGEDDLFIWFLWTYRQLKNILDASDNARHPHYADVKTIVDRAVLIETNIKNNILRQTPFVHVFNPFSIAQVQSLEAGLLSKLGSWVNPGLLIKSIEPLEQLHRLRLTQLGRSIEFNAFITTLKNIRKQVLDSKQRFLTTHELFLAILQNYANLCKEPGCPRNLLPIHIFQKDLIGYTENDYKNLLDGLNNVPLYTQNFAPAYGKVLSQ